VFFSLEIVVFCYRIIACVENSSIGTAKLLFFLRTFKLHYKSEIQNIPKNFVKFVIKFFVKKIHNFRQVNKLGIRKNFVRT